MSELVKPTFTERLTALAGQLVTAERFQAAEMLGWGGEVALGQTATVIPFQRRLAELSANDVA